MAALTAFTTRLRPFAPGALAAVIERAVLDACREFCRKTKVLEETPSAITVLAGTHTYAITTTAGTECFQVKRARLSDDTILTPASNEDLADLFGTPWEDESGPPEHYTQPEENSIRLVPNPDAGSELTVTAYVAPTLTATTVHDKLADKYLEAILAGAKSILFAMNDQPFFSLVRAQAERGEFDRRIGTAAGLASKSNTRVPLRVRAVHRVE